MFSSDYIYMCILIYVYTCTTILIKEEEITKFTESRERAEKGKV